MDQNSDNIFESMNLTANDCFLCGTSLGKNRTKEHVFPKWLIRKHNLSNQKLYLLNGTDIKYSKLTIPCCEKCNNNHLSRIEDKVRSSFNRGYRAVENLPHETLYQWAGKIFYGILRKELQLLADQRDKAKGTIISEDLLTSYQSLHLFLQSIRRPFIYRSGYHFSVLVVNLHSDEKQPYNFSDHLSAMVFAMRSGDVGIIVALEDAGLVQETYGRYVAAVGGRQLATPQFVELFAKTIYQSLLLNHTPKFVTAAHKDETKPVESHMMPIQGLSSKPVVDEWNQKDFAECFSFVLNPRDPEKTFKEIFVPPNLVHSWMHNEEGNLRFFEADGTELPPLEIPPEQE